MEWFDELHAVLGRQGGDITWWQMSVRGLVILAWGLLLLRLAGQRTFGRFTALDFLVALLVGSNLSRALTANAALWPTLAATTAIVLAHILITHLALRSNAFARVVKGNVVELVRDGRMDQRAMNWQGISVADLAEELRLKGVEDMSQVTSARLERSGTISVIRRRN